jgi:hypothetical protein
VLVTGPVAVVAAAGLAIPAVPWLMLAVGGYQPGVIVLLILLGGVLIAALGPLIAIPVGALARSRLRLADTRPLGPGHRRTAAATGPGSWLRARYTDPQAWRETGYTCLLATVVHALSLAALSSLLLSGLLTMQLGLARLDLPPGSPATGTIAAAHEQAK